MFGFHSQRKEVAMRFKKLAVPIVVGTALVLGVGGIAYATIPSSSGTITSCVQKSSGAVRLIDTAKESCKSTESTLPWNQAGVPGTNGVSGYEIVKQQAPADGIVILRAETIPCPAGKKVVGGGAAVTSTSGGQVFSS